MFQGSWERSSWTIGPSSWVKSHILTSEILKAIKVVGWTPRITDEYERKPENRKGSFKSHLLPTREARGNLSVPLSLFNVFACTNWLNRQSNEGYTPQIEINNEALYSLDSVINRLVRIGPVPVTSLRRKDNTSGNSNASNVIGAQSVSPIKYSAIQTKNKERASAVLEQTKQFSPRRSRLNYSKTKSAVRVDGEY